MKILDNKYPLSAEVVIVNSHTKNGPYQTNTDDMDDNPALDSWLINYVGMMTLYNHEVEEVNGKIVPNPISKYKYEVNAAHEFGHLLGLGHAYEDQFGQTPVTSEVPEKDVMRDGSKVTANDIEMVFMAAQKNERQFFRNTRNKSKSEAVRIS